MRLPSTLLVEIRVAGENDTHQPAQAEPVPPDARLYVRLPEGWSAHIKGGWDKDYCYAQKPGDDFFHLLLSGEIYVQHGHDKYCLDCALRMGVLTRYRLHWKHPNRDGWSDVADDAG